jgi:hypothetical protein
VLDGTTAIELSCRVKGEPGSELLVTFSESLETERRHAAGEVWEELRLVVPVEESRGPFRVHLLATGRGALWLDDVSILARGHEDPGMVR